MYRPDIFYRYRRNENSTVHTYHANLVAVTAHLHRLLRTYIVDQQLDEDFNKALDNRIVLCLLNLMRNVLRAPVSLSERVDMARKILSDEEHKPFLQSFPLECLSLKWRLYYWLCRREYAIGALLMTYAAEKLKKYLR